VFRPATTPPRLTTLILLAGLSLLSLNMFLPALAEMAVDFEVDYATMNLALGGYLAAAAVMQLVFGPLSDRYGRRPVLLATTVLFTVVSFVGWLAQDIWLFLACRLLQSGIVAGMVLSRAIICDTSDQENAAALLGQVSMVMALAPMLGPLFGGFLAEGLGWRAIYALYSGMGVVAIWLIWTDVGETNSTRSASMGAQFRQYPELFRSRRFWGYCVGLTFSVGGFYAFIAGAPLVAQSRFDLSPAVLGAGIGTISFGFMVGNFMSGKFTRPIGSKRMIRLGRYCAVLGPLAALVLALSGVENVWLYFIGVMGVGFGNGLTLPGANAGVMSVRPRLAGSASGVSGALTIAGGAVLTSVTGALVHGDAAVVVHLGLIVVCSVVALLGFGYVDRVDRVEGLPEG
jgi:Bcr/CflA subfamily drug resistance transporter